MINIFPQDRHGRKLQMSSFSLSQNLCINQFTDLLFLQILRQIHPVYDLLLYKYQFISPHVPPF